MAIRKWMKHGRSSRSPGNWGDNRRKVPLAVLLCICSAGSLTAEISTGIRILPAATIPIGSTLFKTGYGMAAAFDFMPNPSFGFFIQGEYSSIGLENVTALTLTGGSVGAGMVWRPADRFSVRTDVMAGLYSATRTDVALSGISAGARVTGTYYINPALQASLTAGFTHYAYSPQPLMNALTLGAGVSVNLSEAFGGKARLKVEQQSSDPVFPVLYSWYDDNKFATVTITNNEPNTITDITTSFYLEEYMGQPKVCTVTESLKPGESVVVPLRAFFNESMLQLSAEVVAEGKVTVDYRSLGSKRTAGLSVDIPVYDRNSMSWEDDRRAAAFVSSKDPAALWFSKYAASIVRDRYREGINGNTQYAMGIYESLKSYGLNYVVDPASAYSDKNASSVDIDFLQFPYQTLMYRGGDCDDLSILYCSLLEAIGVDAAFITIPGHIFIAYSAGMTEEEAKANFYDPSSLVYQDGRAWIPLEITLTKDGFNKALRIGMKEWNDASSRGAAHLYPIHEAWTHYKPVSVPGAASRFNLPEEGKTAQLFDVSLDKYIEHEIRPQIDKYEAMLAVSDTAETRNLFGVLYGRFGMLKEAREQFDIASSRGYVYARVNLGNIAFLGQDYKASLSLYKAVLAKEPNNALAILGAARCYYELDDYNHSDSLYAELGTKDAVLGRRYAYLGSFFETRGRAFSMSERLSTTTWAIPVKYEIAPAASDTGDTSVPVSRGGLLLATRLVMTGDDGKIEYVKLPAVVPVDKSENGEQQPVSEHSLAVLPDQPAETVERGTRATPDNKSSEPVSGNPPDKKQYAVLPDGESARTKTSPAPGMNVRLEKTKDEIAETTETAANNVPAAAHNKRPLLAVLAAVIAAAGAAIIIRVRSVKNGNSRRKKP